MSGKYTRSGKRSFGSRSVFLMLALILVIGCTIGGTLAWLTAQTKEVQNTFVAGQIGDLKLEENDTASTTYKDGKYIVIPGMDITKSPTVTYTPTNKDGTVPVDAYVFVKLSQPAGATAKWTYEDSKYVIKSGNPASVVMSFEIADGWTKLGDQDVFYREVKATDSKLDAVSIINGNKITVSSEITEKDVEPVAKAADKLTFQAYAIQKDGFTSETAAWNEVSGANKTS